MANTDNKLRTRHTFMLKKIVDDDDVDGGLRLIGTFVQIVYDLDANQVNNQIQKKKAFFDYRFNEISTTDKDINVRRTESMSINENGNTTSASRTTLEVSILLQIRSLFPLFPFQINLATAEIELSSVFSNSTTVRSNLLLHKHDPRNIICIQNLKSNDERILKIFEESAQNDDLTDKILDSMDKTKVYNVLSPYPEVSFEYDRNKQYCSRFILHFYVENPGFHKLVSILLPMILVTFVATMNVWNDMKREDGDIAANHLQVTSTLTLTIVFVLPQIVNRVNHRDKLLTKDNVNIMVFFVALILASIPKNLAKTGIPELVGVILMGLSLLLPAYHYMLYSGKRRKIKAKAQRSTTEQQFLKEGNYKPDGIPENFAEVGDLLEQDNLNKKCYVASSDKNYLSWNTTENTRGGVVAGADVVNGAAGGV
eukprot:jgi/Psemu1/65532/estExt_Genemark1.C_1320026